MAVAGRIASISANVDRAHPGHRELVGHVRDHRRAHAHADPPQQPVRMRQRRRRGGDPERRRHDGGHDHRRRKLVDAVERSRRGPAVRVAGGDPVAEDDVEHEPHAVREREHEAQRLAGDPDVGERHDARDRQHEGQQVAPGPRAGRRQHHDAEELDGADGRQRQPVDREVEERVHGGQDGAEPEQQPAPGRRQPPDEAPGPPPDGQHDGGARDPQPRDAEHVNVCEEQHGERRPEVVEDRADDEERHRRQPVDDARRAADGGG